MQAKIEKKRKFYLTAELKKLGYKVSLEKNMEATESWDNTILGRFLLEHPQSDYEIGLNS